MVYSDVCEAVFLERLNRFVARVDVGGREALCHVKNTGRCRELFIPGTEAFLQRREDRARKTGYDLIAVSKGARIVNVDSQAPNRVLREWVEAGGFLPGAERIRPEYRYLNSRFDFLIDGAGRRAWAFWRWTVLWRPARSSPENPWRCGCKALCRPWH